MPINKYISDNKDRFLSELLDFLRIPSISANPAHKEDMVKTAEFVAASLSVAGADHVEICETAGAPAKRCDRIPGPDSGPD